MKKVKDIIDDKLKPENIPNGKVRVIDKNILRMHFMGASVREIAKETKKTEGAVRKALNNPAVQREIKRLDRLVEGELVRSKITAERKLKEAMVKASDTLINTMKTAPSLKDRNWAALKVLEYTLGKPRIPIEGKLEVSALTDEDLEEMREGLEGEKEKNS